TVAVVIAGVILHRVRFAVEEIIHYGDVGTVHTVGIRRGHNVFTALNNNTGYPRTVGERSSDKGQSAACCRCFKLSDQRTVGGEKFDSRICGDVYIGKYKTETCHGRWNLRPWDEKQSFHLCRVFHHEETLGAEHLKKVCVGWIYRTEPHSRIGRIAGL